MSVRSSVFSHACAPLTALYAHMMAATCPSPHGHLERQQIQLVKHAAIDARLQLHAIGLLLVGREVLRHGDDALGLHGLDLVDRHGPGEERAPASGRRFGL
jgi:hypothetical protein